MATGELLFEGVEFFPATCETAMWSLGSNDSSQIPVRWYAPAKQALVAQVHADTHGGSRDHYP